MTSTETSAVSEPHAAMSTCVCSRTNGQFTHSAECDHSGESREICGTSQALIQPPGRSAAERFSAARYGR